jgi:hypothetical protein
MEERERDREERGMWVWAVPKNSPGHVHITPHIVGPQIGTTAPLHTVAALPACTQTHHSLRWLRSPESETTSVQG